MLTTLRTIVEEISHIPVLEEALQKVSTMLKQAMDVDCCAIYLTDKDSQYFVLVATDGLAQEAIGATKIGYTEGIVGWIGQREEPVNIADAQAHPRFKHYPEVKEESYHAFLGAPIIHQRKVLGVLSVQQKSRRRFAEEEEALLITLAAQMATEVANAEARGMLSVETGSAKHTGFWKKALFGSPGSPGLAFGEGFHPDKKATLAEHAVAKASNVVQEINRYRKAVLKTKADIKKLTAQISGKVPEDVGRIFQAYDYLLDAASLGHEVEAHIKKGFCAISALKMVVGNYARQFAQMEDPYMRERADDVVDLGNRVYSWLTEQDHSVRLPEHNVILVAEVISATMLAEVPADKLKAIISTQGATNSHAAILARAMGIPAVLGVTEISTSQLSGKFLLVNGYSGEITVTPETQKRVTFEALVREEQELNLHISKELHLPAETQDQQHIELFLNVGLSQEIEQDSCSFASGVGLYRTEIPFMAQNRFPTEHEQMLLYRNLLLRYGERPVTMRTLDVGGDKALPYFAYQEENPFLGWRGIRLTLDHPEIFLVQARAMMRASYDLANLQIMLPMVSSIEEVREAKRLLRQAYYEIREESNREKRVFHKPRIGVMLEVPSVLWQLPELASLVDFFSVGSNDLTQYLLAVDRNNPRVAELYQSFHPSVIRVLHDIALQSQHLNVPVTVCGEIAADPAGVMLLLAMGYSRLSINSHSLSRVKWVIRRQQQEHLTGLLHQVLAMAEASEIKTFLDNELEQQGLGGLVRAGK